MRSCVVAVTLWSCAKGLWLDETEWMQVDSDRKLMRRERLGRERWEWGGGREGGREGQPCRNKCVVYKYGKLSRKQTIDLIVGAGIVTFCSFHRLNYTPWIRHI